MNCGSFRDVAPGDVRDAPNTIRRDLIRRFAAETKRLRGIRRDLARRNRRARRVVRAGDPAVFVDGDARAAQPRVPEGAAERAPRRAALLLRSAVSDRGAKLGARDPQHASAHIGRPRGGRRFDDGATSRRDLRGALRGVRREGLTYAKHAHDHERGARLGVRSGGQLIDPKPARHEPGSHAERRWFRGAGAKSSRAVEEGHLRRNRVPAFGIRRRAPRRAETRAEARAFRDESLLATHIRVALEGVQAPAVHDDAASLFPVHRRERGLRREDFAAGAAHRNRRDGGA
mmetsp:Transcript_10225/g.43460  ORF Transcript_10225/g.43460 Transcript_10225/m.43460 type:complete len:288 (-) Transcript_10225:1024-1887(-)